VATPAVPFDVDPFTDLNSVQHELDQLNTELGFLHPHHEREDFGKIHARRPLPRLERNLDAELPRPGRAVRVRPVQVGEIDRSARGRRPRLHRTSSCDPL
jgi:hypothetical protein